MRYACLRREASSGRELEVSITAGRFDLGVAGYNNTEERQKVVEFVNYLYAVDGLVVLKGNPTGLSTQSLCGKVISTSQGSYQTNNVANLSDACVKSGKPAIDSTTSDPVMMEATAGAR